MILTLENQEEIGMFLDNFKRVEKRMDEITRIEHKIIDLLPKKKKAEIKKYIEELTIGG